MLFVGSLACDTFPDTNLLFIFLFKIWSIDLFFSVFSPEKETIGSSLVVVKLPAYAAASSLICTLEGGVSGTALELAGNLSSKVALPPTPPVSPKDDRNE